MRGVVSLDDAVAMAMAMPEVSEARSYGRRAWTVGGTVFTWERAFSKADIKRFGDAPVPSGPIFAVRVEDLGEKEAVLASGAKGFFTIPHFDGYAAVLVQLDDVAKRPLREAIVDGWLACAPSSLAEQYLARRRR